MNPDVYDRSSEILNQDTAAGTRASELLSLARQGRTAFRAVVRALEHHGDAGVLESLWAGAGVVSGEVTPARLVRLGLGREADARRRSNPIARNEGFSCGHCGLAVAPADRGVQRNHCPRCLYSLHVDRVPGDRESACRGLMAPVAIDRMGGDDVVIRHRCQRCGAEDRNRAALACEVQPDSLSAIAAVAAAVDSR